MRVTTRRSWKDQDQDDQEIDSISSRPENQGEKEKVREMMTNPDGLHYWLGQRSPEGIVVQSRIQIYMQEVKQSSGEQKSWHNNNKSNDADEDFTDPLAATTTTG